MHSTHNQFKKSANSPVFWVVNGASIEKAQQYAHDHKNWKVCKYCKDIFRRELGHKTCCSLEHYEAYRDQGYKKLSQSRLLYNSRDPQQYALKHHLSVDQAQILIDKLSKESSPRCLEYWIKRGHSLEEAKQCVSDTQSRCSPRHISYWMKLGASHDEALLAVSKHQSSVGKKNKIKHGSCRQFSTRCEDYFVSRGFSEQEAKQKVSESQKRLFIEYKAKTPNSVIRSDNWMCKEYYIKRFPDNWEECYADSILTKNTSLYRSIKADEFVMRLNAKFERLDSNRYFGDREFSIYDKKSDRVFMYDYVDTKLKIAVEFNGDYWHGNPAKYPKGTQISFPNQKHKLVEDLWMQDQIKHQALEERGYKLFVVWECDYDNDPNRTIDSLYEDILNESNKRSSCW